MSTSFSIWFLCFLIYLTKEKNSQECITYPHDALAIDILEIKCPHIIELKPRSEKPLFLEITFSKHQILRK
jgi:hypothetical protein